MASRFLIATLGLFVGSEAFAKRTGFFDDQIGISFGVGTYTHPLPHDNHYDPIPFLAPVGTQISGSDNVRLLPAKMGVFVSKGSAEIEPYFRYMLNMRHPWEATGSSAGEGHITFRSYGVGLNLAAALAQTQRARINFVLNGEYVIQRALVYFNTTTSADKLQLKANSLLAGVGLQPELWIGDMWVLSFFAGYQYGFLKNWEVAEAANFMGIARSAGELRDTQGNLARSQFGGLLLELSLKLNFHM